MTLGKLIAKPRPRKDRKNTSFRKQQTPRRRLGQSVERLEARQLLAADLDFSTFFPSTPKEDGVAAIAQDSAGNAYVADYRYDASTFEVSSKLSKVTPDGTVLWTHATDAYAYDIGVDDAGLIYLATLTTDAGLPITSDAYQADLAGDSDFYVMVIDGNAVDSDPSTLSTEELVYASYLGGTGSENSAYVKLAVDAAGGFAIAAESSSSDFPVTSQPGVDTTLDGGSDGVVAYFAPDASGGYSLELSTYLGGGDVDRISGVAIDDGGIIHTVGRTRSEDFPLGANPIQATKPGAGLSGFVTRLTTTGDVAFSTYLGSYQASEVTVDSAGNSYIVGRSWRDGIPVTPGAYAPEEILGDSGSSLPGSFVSKIDANGELEVSSWFQFSRDLLYAVSPTISLDGDHPVISGGDDGGTEGSTFFFRMNPELSAIIDYVDVETVDGGSPTRIFSSEAVDGSIYIGGYTTDPGFATTANAIHPTKNQGADGFVRKYTFQEPLPVFDTLDDFDNGTPDGGTGQWVGAWQLGSNTGFTSSSGPNDGSTHAIIQRRGSLTRQVDVSGVSDLQLSFASKLRSFENSDNAYVRVSPDGNNWTTLKTFVNGEDDNTYRNYSYNIPFESDTLWIQFDGDMSSSRYDFWYVDTVAVTGVIASQPPVANDDSGTTDEDTSVTIDVLLNDSDPEGDSLTIASVTQPAAGSAAIVAGQVQYTPDADFNGSDSFTYTIIDTSGQTATASVDVNISPVNDAPTAGADGYSLDQDTTLDVNAPGVLGNDSDIEGDALTASLITGPSSGSLTLNLDGSFTYIPDAGFVGSDSFSYQAVDTSGDTSDTVTVSLQVNAVVSGPNLSHGVIESVSGSWQTVSLGSSYNSAVIVATPRYNGGSGPGVVRVSNVTATSFDVRVDNAGLSPFSGGVHFIAMEEGVYDVPGEYKLEAVKVDSSVTSGKSGGWQIGSQNYQQSYSNPVVVGQVMSANDEDWSVFWSSSNSRTSPANSGSLNIGKHVAEDTDTTRANETFGYFVIESASGGTINGLSFSAGVGGDTIRGVGNGTFRYGNVTPAGASTAVLSSAGMDGADGGWAALIGNNPLPTNGGSIDLAIDEDQIRDSERNHTTEQVAYFVIGEAVGEGEAARSLATPQITPHNPLDINGDGNTTPLDALQVINYLNASSQTEGMTLEEGDMALDANGDNQIFAIDALLVINRLNTQSLDASGDASSEGSRSNATDRALDAYFGDLADDEEDSLFGLHLA